MCVFPIYFDESIALKTGRLAWPILHGYSLFSVMGRNTSDWPRGIRSSGTQIWPQHFGSEQADDVTLTPGSSSWKGVFSQPFPKESRQWSKGVCLMALEERERTDLARVKGGLGVMQWDLTRGINRRVLWEMLPGELLESELGWWWREMLKVEESALRDVAWRVVGIWTGVVMTGNVESGGECSEASINDQWVKHVS